MREYGHSVCRVGDVDRDGFADMAIGVPFDRGFVGAVHVHSGRDGHLIKRLVGTHGRRDQFGGAIAGAGDVDRDGYPDLIVTATDNDRLGIGTGMAFMISGRTWQTLYTVHGRGPGDLFGLATVSVGDVDGDGSPDFMVGAPENADPINSYGTGYADLFSGKTGKVLHHFKGVELTAEYGAGVGAPGDVDRDGTPDILIGSTLENRGLGSARLYSGKTRKLLYVFPPTLDGDHFGMVLTGAGDVDADGYLDIVVGQPNAFQGIKGRVFVFSGKTGKQLHRIEGLAKSGMHGMCVGGVGDVDRDGHADFACGDPMDHTAGRPTGSVRIYSGKTGKLLHVLYGEHMSFGVTIANLGDLNGDGVPELLIPSPDETTKGHPMGTVRVVSIPTTVRFGFGCAITKVAPSLDTSSFRLDKQTTMFVRGPAHKAGALFWSAIPDVPLRVAPMCNVHLDLGSMMLVKPVSTDAIGRWSGIERVPNKPSLVGCIGALQCAIGPSNARLGVDLTNAMYFTITK